MVLQKADKLDIMTNKTILRKINRNKEK